MMTTEGSESIARVDTDVFAFIADVRNDPRWHTDVLKARLVEGVNVDGASTFAIETRPVMGVSGGTVTVCEYDPPRRIAFDVRMGKLGATTIFTVIANGPGCRVTRR